MSEEFTRIFEGLRGDAKEVAIIVMRRLQAGQEQYGNMNVSGDGRDYLNEIMMELVDAPVYGAMQWVKTMRKLRERGVE
jgi:hypothetical protein